MDWHPKQNRPFIRRLSSILLADPAQEKRPLCCQDRPFRW
jgi:hypothetical protein